VLSKRVLTKLVTEGHVTGWDDPRMPTLAGLRRRGVPAQAVREFVRRIGVARANSMVDLPQFEHPIRELLNKTAPRRMGVLRPLKIVITNYPEGQSEQLEAVNNPEDAAAGTRLIPFARELYVEREDFMENPPKKFYRLSPGKEVRLYNQLFTRPDPGAAGDVFTDLNPDSLERLSGARVEPALATEASETPVQFERMGYFFRDPDSQPGALVFNRTIGLRDSWAKAQAAG
jgi:glutaminyl-tRNA synthetase